MMMTMFVAALVKTSGPKGRKTELVPLISPELYSTLVP